MKLSLSTVLLFCVVFLIGAHLALAVAEGSGGVLPVRQNPLVIPGVGPECPGNLDDIVATTEQEAEQLLMGVVSQIECTYLGNC